STRADARHLDLEYGRIPQALRDVYVPLFARIDVQPAIVQRVEAWAAEVGLDAATDAATKAATNAATSASAIEATNAATIEAKSAAIIGVQVRTWRDDPRRYRKYHRPAVRRLRRLMDSAGDCDRFLVVSDDDAIIAELSARYGAERILHFPRTTARAESWRSAEGVT